ncbi:MAG: tyrosine-type recombinase/integrase [Peptococcaceae bacterium]|nr:tyrosine-type recombinase/integrase [Peptococcaceae bacterium]
MTTIHLTSAQIDAYLESLAQAGRASGTTSKYGRDLRALSAWLDGRDCSEAALYAWRDALLAQGFAPTTINSMLAAANGILRHLGSAVRIAYLRIQRRLFRDPSRELTRAEYERLVAAARVQGQGRLALVMETICATGIRVSELVYITREAAHAGRATIRLKGKIRTILIPSKLCRKLEKYARNENIAGGAIFLTASGKTLSRKQIWAEMKALCKVAGVDPRKVFPHNLRHLFAVTYYKVSKDISHLADLLGHSSIETTRLYLVTSGQEHARDLERLGLVI